MCSAHLGYALSWPCLGRARLGWAGWGPMEPGLQGSAGPQGPAEPKGPAGLQAQAGPVGPVACWTCRPCRAVWPKVSLQSEVKQERSRSSTVDVIVRKLLSHLTSKEKNERVELPMMCMLTAYG